MLYILIYLVSYFYIMITGAEFFNAHGLAYFACVVCAVLGLLGLLNSIK